MSFTRPIAHVVLHAALVGGGQIHPVQLTPREVEVELNDYRTADTFRAVFGVPELPFDPRTLSAIGVDVYLGPAGPDGALSLGAETVLCSGHADTWSTEGGDAGVTFVAEGRDFTGIFLDTRWSVLVDLGVLSRTIRQVVDQVPGASALSVSLEGVDDINLAAGGRSRYTPPEGADAWTVITDLVRMAGAVVFVRNSQIVVSQPATLYGRQSPLTLMWGRDLDDFSLEVRAAHTRKGVKVLSRDPVTGVVGSAIYPEGSKASKMDAQRRQVAEVETYVEWQVANVPASRLPVVARQIWEGQARQAVKGTATTRRLTALDDDSPLYRLRHATAVRLVTPQAQLGRLAQLPPAADVSTLTRGPGAMRPEVAQAFVAAARSQANCDEPFYVEKAKHRWSMDQGYRLSIDFINYVTLEVPRG